jgi:hypothetical protein
MNTWDGLGLVDEIGYKVILYTGDVRQNASWPDMSLFVVPP